MSENNFFPGNPFRKIWMSLKLRVGNVLHDIDDIHEQTGLSEDGEFQTSQIHILTPLGCGHCTDVNSICKYGEAVCRACISSCSICSSPVCIKTVLPNGPHSFNVDGNIICRDCYKVWFINHAIASEENIWEGLTDKIEKFFSK